MHMRRDRTTQWRWRPRIGALAIALLAAGSRGEAQAPTAPLTSAPIDPSIYRDGEVRRFTSVHGNWRVVCDEVTRLRQRFCSLRSAVAGADGAVTAELTVSTGQDGRPAGLLKIAATLVHGGSVEITTPGASANPEPSSKGKAKPAPTPPAKTALKPVGCDERICTFIWTLRADQITALNDGRGLNLLAVAGPGLDSLASFKPVKPRTIALNIAAEGFKEAVAVSLKPFE
jgi:invasion protein IalB